MFFNNIVSDPAYYITVVLVVIVWIMIHELGHVFAALYEGDQTPREEGYLTLDPFVLMGPISVLILCVVGIAWGAVPVRPANFRHRHGDALVAFAGPLMNLFLMSLSALILVIAYRMTGGDLGWLGFVLKIAIVMNAGLFLLNMIPLPPFDGHSIVQSYFPDTRSFYESVGPQGVIIVFLLFLLPLKEMGLPFDFGDMFWQTANTMGNSMTTAWFTVF